MSNADLFQALAVTQDRRVEVHDQLGCSLSEDQMAEEVPVAMVYNGISHAVMMASPGDLEDFALGFSLTEGILKTPEQLFAVDVTASAEGLSLEMYIAAECFTRLKARRRNLAGRTGCGLCGTESLTQAMRCINKVSKALSPRDTAIQTAVQGLRQQQPLQDLTGATHGAAWCNNDGQIQQLREDVGRHNALDKLIGAQIREQGPDAFTDGFALISSRASFEMVHKAASVDMPCLVALSAATALAVREAQSAGMTLIGFARPGRHVRYTPQSPERQGNKQ